MPKNIVVFSDGTGQDGGVRPDQRLSNVYKMYRAARVGPDSAIDPSLQVAFYDPGLGTDDDTHGIGRIWRTIAKFLASVAGRGIGTNIADCYEFVINHCRPGDRIFIVGFSRGAYTARCVAQVISLCGVPTHAAGQPGTPFRRFARSTRQAAERAVHQVYEHGAGHKIADFEEEREEQARRFKADYGSADGDISNAYPYFVGVFDTVAALGAAGWKFWGIVAMFAGAAAILIAAAAAILDAVLAIPFWPTFSGVLIFAALTALVVERRSARRVIENFPTPGQRHVHYARWRADNYDRGLSGHVGFARQASAIDEDRADFPRVAWGRSTVIRKPIEGEPPPLVQLWFAGNHSDIGGSYPEVESRLSDVSLRWMIEEAEGLPHPMLYDRRQLSLWPDPSGMQHSEVQSLQDRKLWWVPKWAPAWLRRGWQYGARKPLGGIVHPSVHARFAGPDVAQGCDVGPYRPSTLATDDRFRHFYDGSAVPLPDMDDAKPLTIALDPAGAALQIGLPSDELDKWMAQRGAEGAVIVLAADPAEHWDDYTVALRLRELDRSLSEMAGSATPVWLVSDGSRHEAGRLFVPADGDQAKSAARSIGRPWIIAVGDRGSTSIIGTFTGPKTPARLQVPVADPSGQAIAPNDSLL